MRIPRLQSTRLNLRPYQAADFEEFSALNADAEVRRHVGGPLSREKAATLFQRFVSGECALGCEVWAVTDTNTGDYVGHCWFTKSDDDQFPELGFLIKKCFWRRGFGTETARAMLRYARSAGYARIHATVDTEHIASIHVLERAGMKREREASDDEGKHFVYTFDASTVCPPLELQTSRLLLRRWTDADREPFAAMNSDPRVMEHFPAVMSRQESDEAAARIEAHFNEHGFGLWAVEIPNVAPFAGFVGLSIPRFEAHFTPCVEIGWRLAADYWGRGYATEGARAAMAFGFDELGLDEIVSFTVPANIRSRRVMEKLGMVRDPAEDFEHPMLPEGHPLRRHVLYRIGRSQFSKRRK